MNADREAPGRGAKPVPVTSQRIAGHLTGLRQLGEGPRPALALHCSLAHGGAWAPLAQALPGFTLTAPDMPGHGVSDPPGDTDLHALSTMIAAGLAASLASGAPVDVIGHSFGATVALRLALERPDLVRSLTLAEPVLFAAARGHPAYDATLASQLRLRDLLERDPEEAAAIFHAEWGGGLPFAALPQRQRQTITGQMYLVTAVQEVLLEDSAALLAPGRLEALHIPVLLAEGSASPPVVGAIHDTLAARIPGARRLVVEGASHMLPLTHPAPIAAAMMRLTAAC